MERQGGTRAIDLPPPGPSGTSRLPWPRASRPRRCAGASEGHKPRVAAAGDARARGGGGGDDRLTAPFGEAQGAET